MQHYSVCPGCGRLIRTRYPFMHQSGRTAMVFCLASCFVSWHREQTWRQQQSAGNSGFAERQATVPARAPAERWQIRPAPSEAPHG
jgi:hypothetical protein